MESWLVVVILVAVDFGIQWICFPIAYGLKTEKFFDLAGSATHLIVVWLAFGLFQASSLARAIVQCVCVSLWCIRLGAHLAYRAARHGDNRFTEIRTSCPRFFVTWCMQAVWVACNLAPTVAMLCATREGVPAVEWRDYLGWCLFAVGLILETVADSQKLVFKSHDENRGKFINTGLWSVSRHPNYFGEILLWWSLALAASANFNQWYYWFTWVGPLLNTLLICFISGIPMLEKSAYKRWGGDPDYQAYLKKTAVLVPFIPCPLCGFCKE